MGLQHYLLLLPLLAGFSREPFMLCTPPELLLPGGYLLQNASAPLVQHLHLLSNLSLRDAETNPSSTHADRTMQKSPPAGQACQVTLGIYHLRGC